MNTNTTCTGTVLVVGGSGYFGRLLSADLLSEPELRIVIGGRNPKRAKTFVNQLPAQMAARVSFRLIDLNNIETINLQGIDAAVCAAGPFQTLPPTLLRCCLKENIPYVDLADARDYVREVKRYTRQARDHHRCPPVCTGFSAVPALAGILARFASEGLDNVESVHIQIAPANRSPRSYGTVASLMASLGQPMLVRRNGDLQWATGWSAPRYFKFPAPVGTRRGYLVDVPGLDMFYDLLGAKTIEFRAGAEVSLLNHTASLLAWMVRKKYISSWARWSRLLRWLMATTASVGHDHGAVGVWVNGHVAAEGASTTRQACIVAEHSGQAIAILPAAIMVRRMLTGQISTRGLVSPWDWISHEALETECTRRGHKLVLGGKPLIRQESGKTGSAKATG